MGAELGFIGVIGLLPWTLMHNRAYATRLPFESGLHSCFFGKPRASGRRSTSFSIYTTFFPIVGDLEPKRASLLKTLKKTPRLSTAADLGQPLAPSPILEAAKIIPLAHTHTHTHRTI